MKGSRSSEGGRDRVWRLTAGTHHSGKLYENIERLKLTVDHILPLHGRMAPLAEPLKAIRQGSVEQQVKQKELCRGLLGRSQGKDGRLI